MAHSSGIKSLITEVASWAFVATTCTLAVIYLEDI
jgi:hypothetical protein